jgi:hypothetical protein
MRRRDVIGLLTGSNGMAVRRARPAKRARATRRNVDRVLHRS